MASSSNKTTSSQRVNAYLDCLQEEFELQSGASSNTRRFKVFLGNVKGEFELMSEEIESLRKERDEYKTKVKNLIDRTISCDRCSKEIASAPGIVVPSQMKTKSSLFASLFFQSKSRDQPGTSDASSQEMALTQTRRSTQQMTLVQRLHSAITPTRPSQSTSRSLDAIIARPLSPDPSASIFDAGSGPDARDWSITFNSKAEKELEVELTHALFHEEAILEVKFSHDGKSLAAGCEDGKVYIYDVETGTLTCVLRNLFVDDEEMTAVCFRRDGKCLATGTWDGYICIWEIKEKHVRNTFRGHTRYIQSLDFSPNGRLLVSASLDNTVRLWNMRDGSAKILIEDTPTFLDDPRYDSAVFSPDGRYVAAGHCDGIARMWDVRTGRLMRRLNMQMQDCLGYLRWTDLKFMPDGKGLVSASGHRTLQRWDISTFGATRTKDDFDPGVEEQIQPEREFSGHKSFVFCLAISPDGRWVASGSEDKSVRIWDARTAVMQCILNNVHDLVFAVDISPSGHYLASGGKGGMVRIWRYMTTGGS